MNPLSRKEQIEQRTQLFNDRDLLIRYREKLKYQGIVNTKQGTQFHKWFNDDSIRTYFFTTEAGQVHRLIAGKLVPQTKYREFLNSIS